MKKTTRRQPAPPQPRPRVAPPAPPVPPAPNIWSPPAQALSIWLSAKNEIVIGYQNEGKKSGYSVKLYSENMETLGKLIYKLLLDRREAPFSRIGEQGSPTQYMLELIAKSNVPITREEISLEDVMNLATCPTLCPTPNPTPNPERKSK